MWANSIQLESVCALTIVALNCSCRFFHGLLSWHSLLPLGLSILGTRRGGGGETSFVQDVLYQDKLCFLNLQLSCGLLIVWKCVVFQIRNYWCSPVASRVYFLQVNGNYQRWRLNKRKYFIGDEHVFCDAALARQSACLFSSLGIWTNLTCSSPTRFRTCSRYFFIILFSIRSHHSPNSWPLESRNIWLYLWPLWLLRDPALPLRLRTLLCYWLLGSWDEPCIRYRPLLGNRALYSFC